LRPLRRWQRDELASFHSITGSQTPRRGSRF
jgi:hypothetical protein